jgi:hypothetical protein
MTTNGKPGNQPDPGDMSGAFEADGEAGNAAEADAKLAAEEEVAAKLGDFA